MTDINGGSGGNGVFELDSLGVGHSEEGKPFSEAAGGMSPVSYTHLTLPTILLV